MREHQRESLWWRTLKTDDGLLARLTPWRARSFTKYTVAPRCGDRVLEDRLLRRIGEVNGTEPLSSLNA